LAWHIRAIAYMYMLSRVKTDRHLYNDSLKPRLHGQTRHAVVLRLVMVEYIGKESIAGVV